MQLLGQNSLQDSFPIMAFFSYFCVVRTRLHGAGLPGSQPPARSQRHALTQAEASGDGPGRTAGADARPRPRPQASCRRTLFTREGASEQSVPTSNVGSLSILRQVFRHADRRERQQRRASGTPGPPASYTLF